MASMRGILKVAAIAALIGASPVSALDAIDFRVEGAGEGLTKTLRGASLVLQARRDKVTDPQELFAAAQAEYGRIVGALYANGYYSPVVHVYVDGREAAEIPPIDTPNAIGQIMVTVNPGPPFVFSRASVAPLTEGTRLPDDFRTGERAESELIKAAVAAGIEGWRDAGHAKAATSAQRIVADHAAQTLSADVTLAPGPRLRFGPLTIVGQDRMKERRIQKIAGLPEGEVFDPEELRRASERLRRTGVFKSVTLTEDDGITTPDLLGITATVVEELPRRFGVGAELSSLDGLDLTGFWLHRNLLGGAERLRIEGQVANIGAQSSGVDYSLGITLDRPATFTPDTTVGLSFDLGHLNEADYDADFVTLGLNAQHYFSDTLTGRLAVEYSAANVTDSTGQFDYRHLSLPVGLIWDRRDDKLDAKSGFYLDVEARPFQGFGFTQSGLRLYGDARAYRNLGGEDRPFVLAGRVQAGAVTGASLLGTPRDYLFYSGGGGTVRGHPYQSLGVNVLRSAGAAAQTTGGMAFLAASVEARAMVTDSIGIVGFVDAGHVGALDFFDGRDDWHAGAGLGLRYATGFGPIRLDVAAPVAGKTGDGVQIYIGIGQSF